MGGKFEVKAEQHQFLSGERVISNFPILPEKIHGKYNVSVQLTDSYQIAYKNKAYFAVTESGKIFEGNTDENGFTMPICTEEQENISFHLVDKFDSNVEEEQ